MSKNYEHGKFPDVDFDNKPFHVIVLEDVREDRDLGEAGRLNGQAGVYLGTFCEDTLIMDDESGDSLIYTQSGDLIWGKDCRWDTIETGDMPVDASLLRFAHNKVEFYRKAHGLLPINPLAN